MEQKYDLVVIGTGVAGSTVASACRKAGWSVAIVDELPFGGTCALRGCDPKKVLVGAAEVIERVQRMHGNGVVGDVQIDWPRLVAFKRTFTQPAPEKRERSFRDAGIAMFHGHAAFAGPNAIAVGNDRLHFKHAVIATGAIPQRLNIDGFENLTTSDEFMELDELPKRIAFVGGGYISFEFAHLAACAGSEVTILEFTPHVLDGFEPELVDKLVQYSRSIGIRIRTNAQVKTVRKNGSAFEVVVHEDDRDAVVAADLVVHGAGRVPNVESLELDRGNVKHDKSGVVVNAYLQSVSNPNVYGAGDCVRAGGLPLTPVAGAEGEAVAANLLHGNTRGVDFTGLVSIAFANPPLALVGLTEQSARKEGLAFRVASADTTEWYSSRRINAGASCYKLLIDEHFDRLIGAHFLGPHAEQLVNIAALAIKAKVPVSELRAMLFGWPTGASDLESMIEG